MKYALLQFLSLPLCVLDVHTAVDELEGGDAPSVLGWPCIRLNFKTLNAWGILVSIYM